MAPFTGNVRVCQYELLCEFLDGGVLHLETLTMRSLTLTGAAFLAVALMTGCGDESGPTAESAPGLTADAQSPDHSRSREVFTFEVENPCNGELITFTGESFYQVTSVGIQEGPDAGQPVHFEFQGVLRATGTVRRVARPTRCTTPTTRASTRHTITWCAARIMPPAAFSA